MAQNTEADRYLIEQIRRGNSDGWTQLVGRYQGRLLAFARSQLSRKAEAEDLVQETFLMFLQSLRTYRDECSLETYLFTILRRKMIDLYRGRKWRTCLIADIDHPGSDDDAEGRVPSAEPSASWYVRRDEQEDKAREVLSAAMEGVVARLKQAEQFRDLKILEILFYAQMRNKLAAEVVGIDEKHIALIKHRMIRSLQDNLPPDAPEPSNSLLTEVWEMNRFTCPKRSTIGRFVLGTLDGEWGEYVAFHVNRLGCRFCQANLNDLQKPDEPGQEPVRQRIYESTIGFFKPS